jgi:23S rRNA pseudouridine1911/1915/1917 synthase
VRFIVGESEAGERLDTALASLADVSRSQARRWIDADLVRVNRCAVSASRQLRIGDAIDAQPPEPVAAKLAAEPIGLDVVYEDADLLVVNKPAGLVVHPAPGHASGTLVNALLHHCGRLASVGGVLRPGIVHRLDRGTSGVLVVAKTDLAHAGLALQFADHSVERVYYALVRGVPREDSGRVDLPIGRHPRDRKRMSVRARRSREAHTAWRVARRFIASACAWLEIRPETGRTHQIRVHLASVGLPIVGDPVYGAKGRQGVERTLGRPALHAQSLGFTHPRSGERLRFESPPAPDLAALLAALERREAAP